MRDRPRPSRRADFRLFRPISTRWMDNDAYGHLNNVVYYALFDTAVNAYLVENGFLNVVESPEIGVVVETGCAYFESLSFPESAEAGLAVESLGRSSVRYALGIFKAGAECAAAQGHFVHVYVDRATRRPVDVPAPLRDALRALQR